MMGTCCFQTFVRRPVLSASRRALFALCTATAAPLATAWPQTVESFTLPALQSESYTLANGLRVVLHEDHKAPIANVYVAYRVGSAAESPGRTGLAHLIEHLMFRGSEHSTGDYETELNRLGATGVGGVTHQDYTRYFETVPSPSLATALWMEAERMCCLLGAITQERLDEQRRVVRNEILEGQNQPYGRAVEWMLKNSYPAEHPYSWPAVGNPSDLDRISVDELKAFFRANYAPNNAVLVITGDFVTDSARAMIDRYFAGIPPGGSISRMTDWVVTPASTRQMRIVDHVPQPRLNIVWNVPGLGTADFDYLQLVANMLGSQGAPLAQRLARDSLATEVSVWLDARLMSSSFIVQVMARNESGFPQIRKVVEDELKALQHTGPAARALALAKVDITTGFARRLERLGGFGGQSDEIGTNVVFSGDPAGHLVRADRVARATADTIRTTAARWLRNPASVAEWVPIRDPGVIAARPRPPRPRDAPPKSASLASVERATLKNGLTVMFVRRPGNRLVSLQILLPGGSTSDPVGREGLASLAMAALTQGTTSGSSGDFASDLRAAGVTLQARADADYCTIVGSFTLERLAGGIRLVAQATIAPAFAEEPLDRLKEDQIRRASQTAIAPTTAWRPLIIAAFAGGEKGQAPRSETPLSIGRIDRRDVAGFHSRWIRPDSATIIVSGDVALPELLTIIDREFGPWQRGDAATVARAVPPKLSEPLIYLVDRPGAVLTDITVAVPLPRHNLETDASVDLFATAFGSGPNSRLSEDLRTSKGWSYSPSAGIVEMRSTRLLLARAPVQSRVTIDAMREIRQLVHDMALDRSVSAPELEHTKAAITMSLPGRWETTDAITAAIAQLVRTNIAADDYWSSFPSRVAAVSADNVTAVARGIDASTGWVWVLVGDRSRLEAPLRAAGLGRVMVP